MSENRVHKFSEQIVILLALFEIGYDFNYRIVNIFDKRALLPPEFLKISPFGTIPILQDGPMIIQESSLIAEYADLKSPQRKLFPTEATSALEVRFWDRFVDNRLIPQCGKIFFNLIKPEREQDKALIDSEEKKRQNILRTSNQPWGLNIGSRAIDLLLLTCH